MDDRVPGRRHRQRCIAVVALPSWKTVDAPSDCRGARADRGHLDLFERRLDRCKLVHICLLGSLLAFYRDGRMLAIATAIVLGDRLVRGVFWPEAVNGASLADPWGFLEYAAWLITADVILYLPGRQSLLEVRRISLRQAHLETRNEEVATSNIQLRAEVAELQRTQRTLEVAKEFAEAANRAQNEFLSSVAHELRSRLNAVIGFSDVLSQQIVGSLNEDQMQCVTDILESGRCLLGLISDVLDVAKMEAASTNFELAAVSLEPLVERAIQMFRERAIRRGVRLVAKTDPDIGAIEADEHRMKQLIFKLLIEALKSAPDGGEVEVVVRREADSLVLTVSHARPQNVVEPLESMLHRASGVNPITAIGTSVRSPGLAVAHQIAELHGGTLRVESPEDGQIRFVVTLPHAAIDDGTTLAAVGPLAADRPLVE